MTADVSVRRDRRAHLRVNRSDGPNGSRVRPPARAASRRKARKIPTCRVTGRSRVARAAALLSMAASIREASAPNAIRICDRAHSACISIPAHASNAHSRLPHAFRQRTLPTSVSFFPRVRRGSAKPHRRRPAPQPNPPVHEKRSTICSSSRHFPRFHCAPIVTSSFHTSSRRHFYIPHRRINRLTID